MTVRSSRSRNWPLVAVCGLAPGAGTSTLALGIARAARAAGNRPLLCCELDGAAGGLAEIAGQSTKWSLAELAGRPRHTEPAFAVLEDGVRLIASSGHRPAVEDADGALEEMLGRARVAHAATIVDCGALQSRYASLGLELASHVVWVVAADARAVHTVEATLLDGDPVIGPGVAPELTAVVAHHGADPRVRRSPARDLAATRARRGEALGGVWALIATRGHSLRFGGGGDGLMRPGSLSASTREAVSWASPPSTSFGPADTLCAPSPARGPLGNENAVGARLLD
jgi:hypothetical protein